MYVCGYACIRGIAKIKNASEPIILCLEIIHYTFDLHMLLIYQWCSWRQFLMLSRIIFLCSFFCQLGFIVTIQHASSASVLYIMNIWTTFEHYIPHISSIVFLGFVKWSNAGMLIQIKDLCFWIWKQNWILFLKNAHKNESMYILNKWLCMNKLLLFLKYRWSKNCLTVEDNWDVTLF